MKARRKVGGRKYLDRSARKLMIGFERLPTALLEDIMGAADELTGSNCWWVTYKIGPVLRDAAEMELDRREKVKQLNAKNRTAKQLARTR